MPVVVFLTLATSIASAIITDYNLYVVIVNDLFIAAPSLAMTIYSMILYYKQAQYIKKHFNKEILSTLQIKLSKIVLYPLA